MAARLCVLLVFSVSAGGCGLLGCGKSWGSGASEAETAAETLKVTPKSESRGAVTATVDATSDQTLVLSTGTGTAISETSVSFPPGSPDLSGEPFTPTGGHVDIAGKRHTAPWSIGAYEID